MRKAPPDTIPMPGNCIVHQPHVRCVKASRLSWTLTQAGKTQIPHGRAHKHAHANVCTSDFPCRYLPMCLPHRPWHLPKPGGPQALRRQGSTTAETENTQDFQRWIYWRIRNSVEQSSRLLLPLPSKHSPPCPKKTNINNKQSQGHWMEM